MAEGLFSGFLMPYSQKEVQDPKRKHSKALGTFCQIPLRTLCTNVHSLNKTAVYLMRGNAVLIWLAFSGFRCTLDPLRTFCSLLRASMAMPDGFSPTLLLQVLPGLVLTV